ncbi:DUF397 domain-containing protein [Actinoallomurus purpureus]
MSSPEQARAIWRKSTRSGSNESDCVEVTAVSQRLSGPGGERITR